LEQYISKYVIGLDISKLENEKDLSLSVFKEGIQIQITFYVMILHENGIYNKNV